MKKTRFIGILAIVTCFITALTVIFLGLNLFGSIPIIKNQITISSTTYTKEYNGVGIESNSYDVSYGSLFEGDHLEVTFTSIGEDVGVYDSIFEAKVFNSNNLDVTENYAIEKNYGKVTIIPRNISLYIESKKEDYNGKELTAGDCEIVDGQIVDGQEFRPNVSGSITNIGSTSIKIDPHVYEGDREVTSNYRFTANDGILIKTKIDLRIKSNTLEKPYDGKPLTDPLEKEFEVIGTLAEGDRIEYSNLASITNAGAVLNSFDCVILNANNEDVTENYNLKLEFGILSVKKKLVAYKSKDINEFYTGVNIDQSNEELELASSVAETDEVLYSLNGSYINCGEYPNRYDLIIRNKTTLEDVSANYDINATYGTVNIKKRELIIQTLSGNKIYDGKTDTGWKDVNNNPISSIRDYRIIKNGLLPTNSLDIEFAGVSKNVGSFSNNAIVRVRDENNNIVTGNYAITLELGKLEILPRELTLMASSCEKTFDGTPLVSTDWYFVNGSLTEGEYLSVEVTGQQTAIGDSPNKITSWRIFDENDNEISNGAANYKVTTIAGTLWVYGQSEIVTLAPKDIFMSKEQFDLLGITSLEPSDVVGFDDYYKEGYEIDLSSIIFSGSLSDCGSVVTEILNPEDIQIKFNGANVSSKFEIYVKPGFMQIYSLDIEITSASASFEYDGQVKSCHEIDAASVVVKGVSDYTAEMNVHSLIITIGTDVIRISFDFSGEITNVGVGLNKFTAKSISVNYGVDNRLSEYRIHTKYGKLSVTRAQLHVTTANATAVAGTGKLSASDVNEQYVTGLMPGDRIYVKNPFAYESSYATVVDNTLEIGVTNSEGLDVTNNYIIIYTYGKLTFTN